MVTHFRPGDLLRALAPLLAAILLVEALAHLALLRAPELVVYPVVLFVAYRHGLLAALAASLLGSGYVASFYLRFGGALLLDDPLPRHLVLLLGAPILALALGRLADRSRRLVATEREARHAAEEANAATRGILESITDGFLAIDASGRITYVNAAAEAVIGRLRAELVGREVRKEFPSTRYGAFYGGYLRALQEGGPMRFEAKAPAADQWLEVQVYPSEGGMTVYFRDVTDRRRAEDRLRAMSLVDELTGLYNRRGFFTLSEQQRKLAVRRGHTLTLVFFDLDQLKQINDSHGHKAGDAALVAAAALLRESFRESDVVARLGGDEFAGLALESGAEVVPIILGRLRLGLEKLNGSGEFPFRLSLSVGTSTFDPAAPCSVEELVSRADAEMYAQKRRRPAPEG